MKSVHRFICVFFCGILSLFLLPCLNCHAEDSMTVEAEIPVSCLSVDAPEGHIYRIMIEPRNSNSPAPKSGTLQISESGTGKFQIDITEPGAYDYLVYEQAGDDERIVYDSSVYHVTITVQTADQNKLAYTVTAYKNDETTKTGRLEFRNEVSANFVTDTTSTTLTTTVTTTETTTVTSATVTTVKKSGISTVFENITSIMTGDRMPVKLLLSIIVISAAVICFMLINKKHRED